MKTLTDRSIQSLKPRDVRYDVRDAALPGLSLRVNANGTKTWTVKVSRDGIQQRVTLGKYPDVRLAEARLKAAERKETGIRVSVTVKDIFSKYLEEIKLSKRSWRDVETVARLYMLPFIGSKEIDMVTALDGVALLDSVTKRSSRNRAAMTLAYLRPFFRWAAGKSIIPTNPWAVLVAPQNTTQARERVLTFGLSVSTRRLLTGLWRGCVKFAATLVVLRKSTTQFRQNHDTCTTRLTKP